MGAGKENEGWRNTEYLTKGRMKRFSKLTRVWIVTTLSNATMTRVTMSGNIFSLRK
ncbi:hypothetical protein CHCC5023_1530 [Bacillus paralicheniformis]|nr:hypothetical protein CHCC5023_1530 [Bacillus paralicheniformis]